MELIIMNGNYEYPLIDGLTVTEMTTVINFFNQVELAYENGNGVNMESFRAAYDNYRKVIPSKSEQKKMEREFKNNSGYDSYAVIKQLKNGNSKMIKL